jgi:hypothetical protein
MRLQVISAITALAAAVGMTLAAGSLAANGTPCNASPVFAAWGDTTNYIAMNPVGGANALSTVTVGPSAAAYRASCVGLLKLDVRLVARNTGNPSSSLTVSAEFQDATGWHKKTIGTLSGYSQMSPSPVLSLNAANVWGNVTVTLTASGAGARWLVSGVYIDPYKHR